MYIIEIHSNNLQWVAAVFQYEEEGDNYLISLRESGHKDVEVKQVPVADFPVYAIERVKNNNGVENNYFEYVDDDGYLELIREQKENQYLEDDFEAYFTVYYFDQTYFQQPFENSLMGALEHRHVDNYFLLNDSLDKGFGVDLITRLVNNTDIEGLDQLYEQYMEDGTAHERTKLADGYQLFFDDMDYDYACGKLTAFGISLLLPIVEKASSLLEEPLWEYYSRAYMILLEDAIANHPEKVDQNFQKAIYTMEEYGKNIPEHRQESLRKLALVYEMMTEHHHFDEQHWAKAITHIQQSIKTDPVKGDWRLYLNLLYVPFEYRKGNKIEPKQGASTEERYHRWRELRIEELQNYAHLAKESIKENPEVSLVIAMAFKRLREDFEWRKVDMELFPEEESLFWLKESQKWMGMDATHFELLEAGSFFSSEGERLENIDLLEKAVAIYESLISLQDDPAFELINMAAALEEISDIHRKYGKNDLADDYRDKITALFEDNITLVRSNPSVFMRYTEYMERCYFYPGNIDKPSLEKLKSLIIEAEEDGQGMYSHPTMMRIRLALHEKQEEEAIFHLTRMLLLHELCMENAILELKPHFDAAIFPALDGFIRDTLRFMKEVEEGYYLDPKIRWKELKEMSPEEVATAWQERMAEIRNRKV